MGRRPPWRVVTSRHAIASAARSTASATSVRWSLTTISGIRRETSAAATRRTLACSTGAGSHLELAVRIVDGGEAFGDVPVEIVGPERLVEGARIEQLVEQHRVPAQKLRDPGLAAQSCTNCDSATGRSASSAR